MKNRAQNDELRERYRELMKQRKASEDLIAVKHVSDQHQAYDRKRQERERFLKRISSLNEKIEDRSKIGAFQQIHTIQ